MPGFGSIIGQEKPVGFLTVILEKGTIPNAMLFTGPEGVGKRSAAFAFAMAANCGAAGRELKTPPESSPPGTVQTVYPSEPCGACRSCGKFESGNHPDFIRVDPVGQFTKIAQIRQLRQVLAMKPYEAKLRVVVIGQAHTMNAEASNALLKVLEEPPDRTILILSALQTSDLLPTIVSRCRHIRFHPIPAKLLAEALVRDHGVEPRKALILAGLANGSFSRALALKNTDLIVRRDWLIGQTTGIGANPVGVIMALAEKLSKNKDNLSEELEIVKTWFRDLLIAKYDAKKIVNADLENKVLEISKKYTENELLNRIAAVQRAQKAVDSNANPRLAMENLVLTLAESSRDD